MSLNMHMGFHDLPNGRRQLATLHIEGAASLQVSKETEPDLNVANKTSFQRSDSMVLAIDRHLALHGGKNACFKVRRIKVRIGFEMQKCLVALFSFDVPDKGVGQDFQELCSLLIVMLTALPLLALGSGIVDEGPHLLALPIVRERLPIPLDHTFQADRVGLGDPSLYGLFWLAIELE